MVFAIRCRSATSVNMFLKSQLHTFKFIDDKVLLVYFLLPYFPFCSPYSDVLVLLVAFKVLFLVRLC
jgi:hypothetical protein